MWGSPWASPLERCSARCHPLLRGPAAQPQEHLTPGPAGEVGRKTRKLGRFAQRDVPSIGTQKKWKSTERCTRGPGEHGSAVQEIMHCLFPRQESEVHISFSRSGLCSFLCHKAPHLVPQATGGLISPCSTLRSLFLRIKSFPPEFAVTALGCPMHFKLGPALLEDVGIREVRRTWELCTHGMIFAVKREGQWDQQCIGETCRGSFSKYG